MPAVQWRQILISGCFAGFVAGFSWWLMPTIATWQWADIGFLSLRDLGWLIVAALPILVAIASAAARAYETATANHANAARALVRPG